MPRPQLHTLRRFKTLITDTVRRAWTGGRLISTVGLIFVFLFLLTHLIDRRNLSDVEVVPPVALAHRLDEELFEINNFGSNVNLVKAQFYILCHSTDMDNSSKHERISTIIFIVRKITYNCV